MGKDEVRQVQIIFQNALAHATKIVIHNSKGDTVSVDDIIATAKVIAREVVKIGQKREDN